MDFSMPGFPFHQLLELTQTHVHRVSDVIQPFHPCNPRDSQQSSPPSQFKSINSSALSFLYGPTYPYMTTEKTIALTRWTFVSNVMSLLFNMLSSLVIAFLPRSKLLLILWLHSPSAVIFAQENKVCHTFHCFPTCLPWSDRTGCHELSFLNVEL